MNKISSKKMKIFMLLSLLLIIVVIATVNIVLSDLKNKPKEESQSLEIETSSNVKNSASLDVEENDIVEEIDNFADTKLKNSNVITVTKVDKKMKVATEQLNIRTDTDSKSTDNIVGTFKEGDIISITGECDNDWYEVDYEGQFYYVYGEYLEEIK